MTMCVDHDIIDGGPKARFIQRFKGMVERSLTSSLPLKHV